MADNAEYNKLVSQRNSARAQYNSCSSRINDCDELLRRLRKAKTAIKEQKETFKSIKKSDKNISKEKHDWEGSTYNSFKKKMGSLVDENEYYYKNSLDHVLDAINDEITRIENKKNDEKGLLGRLGSWINSLSNEIENFFN